MSDIPAYKIEHAWRDHFAPIARAAGFTGSGRHFRRSRGELVEAISLQGSSYGGQFAVNLGIQPIAIPDVIGHTVEPKTLKEIQCEFRRRMSDNGCDRWWKYTNVRETMDDAAISAAGVFEAHGLPALTRMGDASSPLLHIDPVSFETGMFDFSGFSSTKVRMARALSLLRKSQGNLRMSREFAKIALANIGSAN